ncbi:hypothetical protein K435DRAFT_812352 [Dendrothele bispora CBS 962.96]|uniref:Uncharacterized protein n=1 Tax=Dendrothele bispora (strain CBS 962.96) TaxID=1314807 RepID=A0A4V4HB07_DENBC|nr:hypothetical protein K435DRAFT_812352 [Dendrothele bispora CBS 962.96]
MVFRDQHESICKYTWIGVTSTCNQKTQTCKLDRIREKQVLDLQVKLLDLWKQVLGLIYLQVLVKDLNSCLSLMVLDCPQLIPRCTHLSHSNVASKTLVHQKKI